ncbi:NTP transferase domain-containing protein [Enterococcus sp. LJL99]
MVNVSAIIMASGTSKRMGTNKLLLDYQGKNFLDHILDLTKELAFFERILVISPENVETVSLPKGVKLVLNHEAHLGQSASVRLGTQVASGDGYLYLTVDQPRLNAPLFSPLVTTYTSDNIVFPVTSDGKPSSPIYFGKRFRNELLQVTGAAGGREVRNRHPETWRQIKIKEPERLVDIDTPIAYQELIAKTKRKSMRGKS